MVDVDHGEEMDTGVMSNWPLFKISEPQPNDVLLLKKNESYDAVASNLSDGQQRFFQMIQEHCGKYAKLNRLEKPQVALEILNAWRKQNPPGRFLETEEDTHPPLWRDVGDKKARSYISKALRLANKWVNNEDNGTLSWFFDTLNFGEDNTDDKKERIGRRVSSNELYDREHHVHQLLTAYNRRVRSTSEDAPEIILLSGSSGTGKTALAKSMRKYVEEEEGFFVTRKFYQRQQDASPNAPVTTAFQDFAKQVRRRGEEAVRDIQKSILCALGSEVHVLVEAVPHLGNFLGIEHSGTNQSEKHPIGEPEFNMDVTEKRSRFTSLWRRLLQAICSPDKPIIMLLDDVQWADFATLDLMTAVLNPSLEQISGLMLLGTVRGNEVSVYDKLSSTLRELENRGTKITLIEVANLSAEALTNMIARELDLPEQDCLPLAKVVKSHTDGNALFAKQYLVQLKRNGILHEDASTGKWAWKEEDLILTLEQNGHDDMIVELLAGKIKQLPSYVVEILKVASCLGGDFDEEVLCSSGVVVSSHALLALEVADEQDIIMYDFDKDVGHFSHDKFQEAAYSLIPEGEKARLHFEIGKNLRNKLSTDNIKKYIFLVVDQLRSGSAYIQSHEIKEDSARLSLRASREAAHSSAFSAAVVYANWGIEQLGPRPWRDQYDLTLDLYSTSIELAHCTGNHEKVDAMSNEVTAHARTPRDKQRATMTQIAAYDSRGHVEKAIQLCTAELRELGESFPRRCGTLRTVFERFRTEHVLRQMREEDILNLNQLEDANVAAIMQFMYMLYPLLLHSEYESSPLPGFRLIQLTMKFGLSSLSGIGFLLYGVMHVRLGNIDDGYRYGHLALRIFEKFPSKQLEARALFAFWTFMQASKEPPRSVLGPQMGAHHCALRNGDTEIAIISGVLPYIVQIHIGTPLDEILNGLKRCEELCLGYRQWKTMPMVHSAMQLCYNLLGQNDDPLVLTGDVMNESDTLKVLKTKKAKAVISSIQHHKYFAATYLNDYNNAYVLYKNNKRHWTDALIPSLHIFRVFFEGLNAAGVARSCSRQAQRQKNIAEARKCVRLLKEMLVHCPENVINKVYLIKAELEFCKGRYAYALLHYEKAIAQSEREQYVSEQALACEKAGLMLLSAKRSPEAIQYFKQAHLLYKSWGATIKVDLLAKRLSALAKEGAD